MIGGRVLDATAIQDLAIGRTIYGAAFLAAANDVGIALAVPATALHDAWAVAEPADYPFLELLLGLPLTVVDELDAEAAQASGILAHDVREPAGSASHTVQVARSRGWPVLTSSPHSLRTFDDKLPIELLPPG